MIQTREVAEILGVSKSNVSRMVTSGVLKPIARLSGGPRGVFVFDREDVEELALRRSMKRHPSSQRAAS